MFRRPLQVEKCSPASPNLYTNLVQLLLSFFLPHLVGLRLVCVSAVSILKGWYSDRGVMLLRGRLELCDCSMPDVGADTGGVPEGTSVPPDEPGSQSDV